MAESVREFVARRIADLGLNLALVSRQIGKNAAYLHQYTDPDRASPRSLPEDVREALAPILGVTPDHLREGGIPAGFRPKAPAPSVHSSQLATQEKIPVLGLGQGSEDGWDLWNGEVVEYVSRPAVLEGVPHAYAVYATGTSMEPRYYPFELLYIHPSKPPQIGDFVLVERKAKDAGDSPRALIKRLVKINSEKVILEQFNPPKTFEVKRATIKGIHKIVGSAVL